MADHWTDYPISMFRAAAASALGGLFTAMIALSIATWIAIFALSDDCVLEFHWLAWPFVFLAPIGIACIQIWGFLYVALVWWYAHCLIHDDAPRLRTSARMLFPQFACTIVAFGVVREFQYFDTDAAIRTLATGIPLLLISGWAMRRAL